MKFTYDLNRSTAKGRSLRGGNEMISSNDRLCSYVKAELTAHLRKLSAELALKTYEHPERTMFSETRPCHIGVIVYPPTKRRMDAPNWYPTVKALIDGLTDAGVFDDDNNKVIRSMVFVPGSVTTNKKYRIEIIIRDWKEVDLSWLI